MAKTRIEYPGTLINERDPEKHFHFQDLGMREYYDDVIRRIPGLRNFEGKALHIGCGTAAFENLLCDRLEFARFYGLESSPTLLRIGEAISSRFGYADRISLKTWNDDLLPYPDKEFDLVISLSSMHQWKSPEKTLPEITRVIKENGTVFISDFRREQFFLPYYFFARRMGSLYGREIKRNLLAGFKASYATSRIKDLLDERELDDWEIEKNGKWFYITTPAPQSNDSESIKVMETEKGG
ncbi:MAG: class I SAM-dependent methyltransferase [Candidatus Zixiibacteriota bacterium]|nr:MAG: class I SAM-dependent methyltransferase [candidate division Zixibacteria bacterium]